MSLIRFNVAAARWRLYIPAYHRTRNCYFTQNSKIYLMGLKTMEEKKEEMQKMCVIFGTP